MIDMWSGRADDLKEPGDKSGVVVDEVENRCFLNPVGAKSGYAPVGCRIKLTHLQPFCCCF